MAASSGDTCENYNILEAISFSLSHLSRSYTLKEEQTQVISEFSAGHNVFVNLQTGYGKSLCYQQLLLLMRIGNYPRKWVNFGACADKPCWTLLPQHRKPK
jgi:superfamily II DNA/RNA helicase